MKGIVFMNLKGYADSDINLTPINQFEDTIIVFNFAVILQSPHLLIYQMCQVGQVKISLDFSFFICDLEQS